MAESGRRDAQPEAARAGAGAAADAEAENSSRAATASDSARATTAGSASCDTAEVNRAAEQAKGSEAKDAADEAALSDCDDDHERGDIGVAEKEDEEDEDEEDDGEEDGAERDSPGVKLGVVSDPELPLTRAFFPSKIGGRPAWLNPRDLPAAGTLMCPHCSEPLRFLLQVYAPVDDSPASFHRTIYLFLCTKQSCLSKPGALRALRAQLPRRNPFYAYEPAPAPEGSSEQWRTEFACDPSWPGSGLCAVCGTSAKKICAGCKLERYCSKGHQLIHWKLGHGTRCAVRSASEASAAASAPESVGWCAEMLQVWRQTLFPERELAIEDEEGSSGEDEVAEITEDAAEVEAKVAARARADKELLERINRETEGNGFEAEDARSEGARALQAQSRRAADRSFRLFKRRIRRRPAQVLRYGFPDGQVLWASDQGRPAAVPPCANCGAARVFEFQVMPQLLLHLNIDHADREAPDWGSLVVFSCPRSCGDGDSGYLEEFAWFHPMT